MTTANSSHDWSNLIQTDRLERARQVQQLFACDTKRGRRWVQRLLDVCEGASGRAATNRYTPARVQHCLASALHAFAPDARLNEDLYLDSVLILQIFLLKRASALI